MFILRTTASATAVLLVLSLLSIANAITKNGPEPCLSLSPTELEKFQNGPTEGLDFPCPSGYALYSVDACFDRFDLDTRRKRSAGEDYDRLWKWKCRPVCNSTHNLVISKLANILCVFRSALCARKRVDGSMISMSWMGVAILCLSFSSALRTTSWQE